MTKKYKSLIKRINEIERNFDGLIVGEPLSEDKPQKQDLIKAYILLCHAEIEYYLEQICLFAISKCKTLYDTKGIIKKPLLSMALMMEKKFRNKNGQIVYKTPQERINKLYTDYNATIRTNNGIKADDINTMLIPIGITSDDIDATLISNLDAFGTKRGAIAHGSDLQPQKYSYGSEKRNVNDIINELEKIDEKVSSVYK